MKNAQNLSKLVCIRVTALSCDCHVIVMWCGVCPCVNHMCTVRFLGDHNMNRYDWVIRLLLTKTQCNYEWTTIWQQELHWLTLHFSWLNCWKEHTSWTRGSLLQRIDKGRQFLNETMQLLDNADCKMFQPRRSSSVANWDARKTSCYKMTSRHAAIHVNM